MIRVLHVIPGVARRYGGPSRAVYDMCRALQSHDCETLVCTTNADGERELPVQTGKVHPYQDVPTIFFRRQWSEAYKYSRPLAAWLESHVKEFDIVHIHAVFSHSSLAASSACRTHNVPYIVRPLGSLSPSNLRQKRLRKTVWWFMGVRKMLLHAAAVHYTTAEERRLAETHLGLNNGAVISLGVEEHELHDKLPLDNISQSLADERNPYVLVLNRLHPIKGIELLLQVFIDLIREGEFSRWRLKIAGEGEPDYEASLKGIVNKAGAVDRVSFLGWVGGPEKLSLLKHASLLALPSHHENFGLSLVEALACGVPVLVSPHVNLAAEISGAGIGWVAELEPETLTRVLKEALMSEAERKRRGHAGRAYVAHNFSWPILAEHLVSLYRSIIEKHLKAKAAVTRR